MIKSISHHQITAKASSAGKTELVQAEKPVSDYQTDPSGPTILLLLDGWGISPPGEANAISSAKMPYFLNLIKEYPVAVLTAGEKSLNQRYLIIGTGREQVETGQNIPTLSKVLSAASLTQLKVTEAERLVALTNFFNGGGEQKLSGEDWQIIPSLAENNDKPATTNLVLFSRALVKAIKNGRHNLIVAAIPTLDIKAVSGEPVAIQTAAAALDKFLKKIIRVSLEKQGVVLISSSHGNAERIRDLRTDLPDKEMTDSPVPLVIVGEKFKGKVIGGHDPADSDLSLLVPAGTLADLAPTILGIMALPKPAEMSGRSLLT